MISIYNADKKELMAIFANTSLAASYVFGNYDSGGRVRLQRRLLDSYRITDSKFEHPVAVRYSNTKHVELLGEKHGIIFEGYPEVNVINIGGIKYTNFVNAKTH
jgi:hypothetical protein